MDLSTIQQPNSREIELLNPATEEGTGLVFIIATSHDPRVRANSRKLQDAVNADKANGKVVADENELDRLRMAAHVLDWRWEKEATWKGKKPAFDSVLAMEILKHPAFYSQMQYEVFNVKSFYSA